MDENLTSHADSRIPGGRLILSGFICPRNRDGFPRFHEDSSTMAVLA